MKLVLGSLFVLALPFAVANADHPRHRPPQAAFDACAKAKAGDACSVTLREHTMKGTCAQAHEANQLVCRPEHPPGPPPAAVDACNGKAAGDACTITHGDRSINGSCAHGPEGKGPLACHPSEHPHA